MLIIMLQGLLSLSAPCVDGHQHRGPISGTLQLRVLSYKLQDTVRNSQGRRRGGTTSKERRCAMSSRLHLKLTSKK